MLIGQVPERLAPIFDGPYTERCDVYLDAVAGGRFRFIRLPSRGLDRYRADNARLAGLDGREPGETA
ncbi:hypothetical protein [Oceanibaculum nanhaiense]|uniref:hypothetical protein n=1 Tax=Oceanibaculum nanhaiense TaxID=1909734 RepID=UPI003D2D617C